MREDWHMSIEDRNYFRDRRTTATHIPEPPKGIPFKWVVCDLCQGRGKVVNPSIDASGLTADDFADDPDFAEAYMAGRYDIQCPQCRGRTTTPEVTGTGPWFGPDGEPICINPEGCEFIGPETEHDRCLCIHCGADGDG